MFSLLLGLLGFLFKLILFFVALIIAVPVIFCLSVILAAITGYIMYAVLTPIINWYEEKQEKSGKSRM